MNIKLQIILIIVSTIFSLFVIKVTSKKKMNFNYTMIWIIFSIIILILALFPNIISSFSNLIGIEIPVNALFLVFIFVLILINLFLSIEVSKLNDKIILLTQEVALLKKEKGDKNNNE